MVFGWYSSPIATGGSPRKFIARTLGKPKSTTAATWSAISGWRGLGTVRGSTPSGTAGEVTKPITAAPCEYPPSTILVRGQDLAIDNTWAPASRTPSAPVAHWSLAG